MSPVSIGLFTFIIAIILILIGEAALRRGKQGRTEDERFSGMPKLLVYHSGSDFETASDLNKSMVTTSYLLKTTIKPHNIHEFNILNQDMSNVLTICPFANGLVCYVQKGAKTAQYISTVAGIEGHFAILRDMIGEDDIDSAKIFLRATEKLAIEQEQGFSALLRSYSALRRTTLVRNKF